VRGDRLLSILLLLQAHGGSTARELAGQLEVSERTIYRDLDALSAAGVPVFAERGRKGGIRLLDDYRTQLTGLTEAEARVLFGFGGPQVIGGLGTDQRLEQALRKLMVALPAAQRSGARRARERLLVDASPWRGPAEAMPHLAPLQDAAWSDQRVRLTYRRGNTNLVERVVNPYGLVVKAGAWYLLGGVGDQMRVFRVSRIERVEVLPETFARPEGFDLGTAWTESMSGFLPRPEAYRVVVRVRPDQLAVFLRIAGGQLIETAERLSAGADGWPRLRLMFPALGAARAAVLGFGTAVEVLAPDEFRGDIVTWARSLEDLYRSAV
jgi:predicted DNA-binding transcriptional regulator YafY